jgi:hypothetical protein
MKREYIFLIFLGLNAYIVGLCGDVFIDSSKYAALSRCIAESGNPVHILDQ